MREMSAIQQNPYILDKVDLGDTDGFGVGLGLNVDQDTKRSRPSSSSSFRSSEQKDFEALQQTPKAPSSAQHESQSVEDQPSSSRSNSSSGNLFLKLPPSRPKRRSRHERKLSHSIDGEKDGDGDLDVQIEAALSFVSRHGMNTNIAQRDFPSSNKIRTRKRIHRNAGLMGIPSQETIRLRSDFRRALSRIAEQTESGNENGKEFLHTISKGLTESDSIQASEERSEGMTAAFAFHSASVNGSSINGGGESSKNGKIGLEGEHEEVHRLLKQARILSREPYPSNLEHATPPTEAIKRAIQDPIGSSNRQAQKNGINTSASTPEGALGRIALPPSLLGMNAEEETEFLLDDTTKFEKTASEKGTKSVSAKINGTIDQNKDEEGQRSLVGQTSDPEALRAGLRFVLGCYDEMSKRIQENTGLSNAIISSIANGKTFQPSLATSSRSDLSSTDERQRKSNSPLDNISHPLSRARLRSGSILRAFSRGKPNFSFDSAKTMLGGTPTMGFSTPSRTTQMTFDALPENVVGPSNRLGMANFVAWSPQEASDKHLGSPDQRQRSISNATSTSSNRNSRYENQDGSNILKRQSSDQSQTSSMMAALKAAKEEAREAQSIKAKLMTEMEQMSEELFLQANEMVKEERIKSSALEKELESLKSAMSNTTSGGNVNNDPTIDLTHSIEAGAQNDNEAMMMAAVAEASRECAEAEEEAEDWRKHCEELESRIAILEEALYNSMALLSQQEGVKGFVDEEAEQKEVEELEEKSYFSTQDENFYDVKGRDSIEETPSRNSLVIPQKAFSESTSSFYSAGDQSSVGFRSPEMKMDSLSPALGNLSKEIESSMADALSDEVENGINHQSTMNKNGKPEEKAGVPESVVGREEKTSLQLEAESVHSTSSPRSSLSSAERFAISPRSSGIGSRRQSRQASLPPRLPEPSSPLPNIPKEQNWLPKSEQGNADGNTGVFSSNRLSARLSVATTASRSSSNLKHENNFNRLNGNEIFRTEGIKTEPIEQLSTFESYPQHNEMNGVISSRKESITTTSTASSPMLQTPPLITATMIHSPYAEKLSSTVSKRGSTVPVVQEEEVMESDFIEGSQSEREFSRKNGANTGLESVNGNSRRSTTSLTPQGLNPSINESDDFERESHETSRAPSYIASSTRPSVRTSGSEKKKSRKRNILKNMPPAAPKGRKGFNFIDNDDDDLNGSIASLSLYSGISSPSIESELKKRNSIYDQEEEGNIHHNHQSKIREHYAKMHQTSPALQDDTKKKQSFARRKRFN